MTACAPNSANSISSRLRSAASAPGCGPIMAAFTHLNPNGSRFSDGSYGVFYCARGRHTAIEETRYHSTLFLMATNKRRCVSRCASTR